jgi:ABC-type amino acid transport substrate-binding protein
MSSISSIVRLPAAALAAALLALACGGTSGTPAGSPAASTPKPSFAADSYMAKIVTKGKLTAGVRQDVKSFGYLNPVTNTYEGFDVDMVRFVAKALFGDDSKVEFKPVTSATRIPLVKEGAVDIVASTMTITDARKQEIDFSDVYFLAGQKVLVKKGSPIKTIQDTAGKNVCAAKGSTSEVNITKAQPAAKVVALDSYQDCLTALQSGRVDAISTDDAILGSLVNQDPSTQVVGPAFSSEPYGLGIQKGHAEYVSFVNQVIADAKKDGRWKASAKKWLGDYGASLEPPPPGTPAPK